MVTAQGPVSEAGSGRTAPPENAPAPDPVTEPPGASPARSPLVAQTRREPFAWLLPALAGLGGLAAFLLTRDGLVDDAYITLSYARNVAFGLHWGLIPDEVANTATSPLNVLLLAAITAVVRNAVLATGVLLVASAAVTAAWLDALARELGLSRALPVIGVGLLLVNPLMLSTVGLEPYLSAALVAGVLRYGAARRRGACGALAGLAVLARPDLLIVVLIVVPVLLGPRLLRAGAAAVAVTLPWYAFSWFALGSALPDTLVMKAGVTWSGELDFWTGPLLYLSYAPRTAELAAIPVAVGGAVLLGLLAVRLVRRWERWQRVAAAAGLGGAAHVGVFGFLHTGPYHWYYAPVIVGATYCAVIATARTPRALAVVGLGGAAALAAVSVADDVGHGVPWVRAPISTNWATAAQYQRIGEDVARIVGTATVEGPGEIGTLAYYCGCTILDPFSDRGLIIETIEDAERDSPLLQVNYLHLDHAQQPRVAQAHLRFQRKQLPFGPYEWPADNWSAGPSRFILEPPR